MHNYVYKNVQHVFKTSHLIASGPPVVKANVFSSDFSTTHIGRWTVFSTRNHSRELYGLTYYKRLWVINSDISFDIRIGSISVWWGGVGWVGGVGWGWGGWGGGGVRMWGGGGGREGVAAVFRWGGGGGGGGGGQTRISLVHETL